MKRDPEPITFTRSQADELAVRSARVFTPRTPINVRELFAGRRDEVNQMVDVVSQVGLHAVLYGERGVGKTSLAHVLPQVLDYFDQRASPPRAAPRIAPRVNASTTDTFSSIWSRIFNMISWSEDAPSVGFKPTPGTRMVTLSEAWGFGESLRIDDVCRALTSVPDAVFVIDEFDRLPPAESVQFTDLIKALADASVPVTVLLVGVAETVDQLVKDHASVARALIQIPLKRMKLEDLRAIIENAERELGVVFDQNAGEWIALMSQGLPHYTHLVGLYAMRAACARLSGVVNHDDVSAAFRQAVKNADQSISSLYGKATTSAQSAALYVDVLLACALAAAVESDASGYFQPVSVVAPLTMILKRDDRVPISVFNKHLGGFCDEKRGNVLERIGHPRSYRFRFREPLMPPYILMRAIAEKQIDATKLSTFMRAGFGA